MAQQTARVNNIGKDFSQAPVMRQHFEDYIAIMFGVLTTFCYLQCHLLGISALLQTDGYVTYKRTVYTCVATVGENINMILLLNILFLHPF